MASKTQGAHYAQLRRDEENSARDEVHKLVPRRYFDGLSEGQIKASPIAKTLKGVIAYLKDTGNNSANNEKQANISTTSQDFGPIRAQTPPWLRNNAELLALQQTMTRLTQAIQNRAIEVGGLSGELKQLLDEGNDSLVDVIQKVEGGAEE